LNYWNLWARARWRLGAGYVLFFVSQ
jgi:hypothetical protein